MSKRKCFKRSIPAALAIFFGSALAFAQLPPVNPAPDQNDNAVGPQLIAWSALQKPEPVPQQPQPIPTPDQAHPGSQNPSQSQTAPDQSAHPNPQQSEPETEKSTSQSVSGTIAKVNNKYVLQTSDSVTYQLDNQSTAGQYVGKRVKVTGTLDRATGIIRVRSIELLS
jgi:Protein of unknown function (DUF5818)